MAKSINSKDAARNLLKDFSAPSKVAEKTEPTHKIQNLPSEKIINENQNKNDKLKQKSVYLTNKQIKAIKLKTIESDSDEHKDESSVIRAAINAYLNLD